MPAVLPAAAHRLLVAGVLVYVLALVVLGATLHPIAVPGGEYDAYVARAEHLLAGELHNDPFHGWLYPLLVAGATLVVGDAFAAGRLVSSLAAGFCLYALARWCAVRHGGFVAAGAVGLLAANAPFALLGLQAASDMLAAALLAAALWLHPTARGPRQQRVVGLCLGLCAATRPGLLPVVGLCAGLSCWGGGSGEADRWRGLAALAAGLVLGYSPHLLLTALQTGAPFHNENWRVLASKAAGWDLAPLLAPTHGGLFDVLAHEGGRLLHLGVRDFGALWGRELGAWLTGRPAVPAVAAAGSVLALGGVFADAWREPRAARGSAVVVGVVVVAYSLLVAFAFQPSERALLPIAPWVLAASIALLLRPGRLRAARCLVAALWFGQVVVAGAEVWPRFVASHALAEVAAAQELRRHEGPAVTVVATHPFLARDAGVRAGWVPGPPAADPTPAALWQLVAAEAARVGADWFLTSRATCWLPFSDLVAAAPPGARVVRQDDAVLLVRLFREVPPWLELATVELAPDGASLELGLRTHEVPGLVAAGFTILPPAGEPAVWPLPRTGPHDFRATLPWPAAASGRWRFVPGCMLSDGRVLTAPALERSWP